MKRHLVLLSAVISIAFPAQAYPEKEPGPAIGTDRDQYGLIGPVAMFRLEWTALSSTSESPGEYMELGREYLGTITFDVTGKLILIDPARHGYCTMVGERVPAYDDEGNLIEEIVYDLSGQFSAKSTFKYDADGNRTESSYYGRNGLIWVRKYDSQGKEVHVAKYNGRGSIEYREVNVFDEKGNNIESRTYNGDGLLKKRERTSYEYDQNGNWIKAVLMDCISENDDLPCKAIQGFFRFITYY